MSIATGSELDKATFDDFVQRLRHHMRGEGVEYHCTADALFTVQARKLIFGIDQDFTDKLAVCVDESAYFSPQEYWDAAEDNTRENLDALANEAYELAFLALDISEQWDILNDLPDHSVLGWDERWDYVNSHFTKEAAEAFIKRKKHDYRDGIRIYVEAQVYCWEFNAIIKGLLDGSIGYVGEVSAAPSAPGSQE